MTVRPDVAVEGDFVDPAKAGDLGCGERGPRRFWCSRTRDHGGQHVASGSTGQVYEVWPAGDTMALTDELIRDLKDACWVHVAAVVRPGADHRGTLEDVDRALTGVLVDALRVLADRPLDPEDGLRALADRIEKE